ncbi:MAG: hypothetical protein IPJ88_10280 [Myxococcales bacterium]|nr:MAG: hypothetical protein IPJ88_10280 [Myxococcales bacterium]
MRLYRSLFVSFLTVAALLITSSAFAELGNSTPQYTARSMTLDAGTLRVDVGPSDFGLLNSGAINNRRGLTFNKSAGVSDLGVGAGIGAAYGVMDGLEIGTLILPLAISPDFDYMNPEFYGRYRLMDGDTQVGLQVGMVLPAQSGTDFGLSAGLPVLLRMDKMRIDTGAELEFIFATDLQLNIDIPFALNYSVTDAVFIGGRTGLFFQDFTNVDFDGLSIPLGAQGGYTLDGGIADLTAWFNFPNFINTFPGGDAIFLKNWQLGLGANVFANFM